MRSRSKNILDQLWRQPFHWELRRNACRHVYPWWKFGGRYPRGEIRSSDCLLSVLWIVWENRVDLTLCYLSSLSSALRIHDCLWGLSGTVSFVLLNLLFLVRDYIILNSVPTLCLHINTIYCLFSAPLFTWWINYVTQCGRCLAMDESQKPGTV